MEEERMVSGVAIDSTPVSNSPPIFKVMCVVSDRQQLSFVEKVQLPQDQILLLCNELVPRSAGTIGTRFAQIRINFNALNQRCLPVVGFYGNKQMMAEAFRKQGFLGEKGVLDQLEPGLYAIVGESAIVVFYWHEGENLKEASRKDVSCNFIRYLVELSDYLYVCVQGYYPFEASASSARTASFKGRRTKKLQISLVKNSENDVSLFDGFNVSIDRQFKKSAASVNASQAPGNVVFCDGYNRCAFLTAEYMPPRVSTRSEVKTIKGTHQLSSQIDSWLKDGDLNFCRMGNEHFVSLLEYGNFPRYDEYREFVKALDISMAGIRVGPSLESSMEAINRSVVDCFLKILPEYFYGAQFFDEASPGTSSSQHREELRGSVSVNRFDQLHQELSKILAGGVCDKKLIFLGSEVKFTDEYDVDHFIYKIEGFSNQSGPLRYGREIILKCSQPKKTLKATVMQFNEETSVASFLFSGDRVKMSIKGVRWNIGGTFEVANSSSIAVQNWVESLIPKKLKCLRRNIGLVALLVSKGATDKQMLLIQNILTAENLKSIERDLPDEIGNLFKQFESTGGTPVDQATWVKLLSNKPIRGVISNFYKTSREEFVKNVESMVRKEFWSALLKKFESQRTETLNELQQNRNSAVDDFLSKMKLEMSVMTGKLVCRFIEACEVQSSRFLYKSQQINLKVSSERPEKPSIAWRISELMPRKNDLEELSRNSEYRLTPTRTDQFDLVSLDPDVERILKVVTLKSGHLLAFIQNYDDPCLYVYSCSRMGLKLDGLKPVRRFRRGYDLLSVDEGTRFVALYDKLTSKVAVHKFDESFRNLDWTGVDVNLHTFSGIGTLTWIHLIPGKRELILIDDTNRVRVVELHQQPMMKPRPLILPSPVSLALVSADGSFFLVFGKSSDNNDEVVEASRGMTEVDRKAIDPSVTIDIYVLADVMSHLRTIHLNKSIRDLGDLQVKIVNFGTQSHLVFLSASTPSNIYSYILKTVSAIDVVQLQAIQSTENEIAQVPEERKICGSCPPLEYIYHIFDKFATSPALFSEDKRDVFFNVLLSTKDIDQNCNERACKNVLRSLRQQLEKEKGKDFSNIEIQMDVKRFDPWISGGSVDLTGLATKAMGTWIRTLACLVPIQIARAENNELLPLKDGLQIPPELSYEDSLSLANLITLGIYDTVLRNWEGEIMVISSMGKQSSGKSYLLNHLSGSLLDVAGGRCTDGVWMTARAAEKRIYVMLDFEGLGSFERTEQEDMLLSVLNAAVSNLTIFNKKDFHVDKETEIVFDRFQNGINLVKQDKDKKLFKGIFYIAIKDVDSSDVDDLKDEFEEKISRMCSKTRENFLSKMYGGKVEIAAMPPYNRPDYHDSLRDIASTVEEMNSCYHNGTAFLNDVKIVISQIAAKDWTSVDGKRVALRVDILRRNLKPAIDRGCLSATGDIQMLVNLDTQEEVSDFPVVVEDIMFDFPDTGLELAPSLEPTEDAGNILSKLRSRLESVVPRKGTDGEWWHSVFESFLGALADRRRKRVEHWLMSNTVDFSNADEVHKLQLEAAAGIAEMKQSLSVCGCKCFWRCILEKGHVSSHSCMGSHVCSEKCSFCIKEEVTENSVEECKDLAGHDGPHDCKMKNHTCSEICDLFNKSSNCNKSCSIRLGHEGPHKCNSPQHMCKKKCSLPSCQNPCVVPIEFGDHDRHACHERYCQTPCLMKGCTRTCGYKDHFHDLNRDAEHLCGNEHVCPEKCGVPGICEIFTELVRQTRQFHGRRGSFEYEHVSEQNGLRKDCCVPVPAFKRSHEGHHVHTTNEDAVHYCETRCHSCGYFCRLPTDHPGLHNTVHGNMRNVKFFSESEEIDIDDRKYAWRETGLAEICNMHCRKQGRGHIHLVPCPENCTRKLYDGSRHETRKYGPDLDVPKYEMNHETYWKYIRFVDPCTEEEQNEFGLCNHYCRSEEHEDLSDKKAGAAQKSYCTEKLWHAPIKRTGLNVSSAGYITDDGHHFGCDHSKNVPHHVIFVIEKSGSMGSTDIRPTMSMFSPSHDFRLGCVFEAIIRFIRTRLRTVSDDSVSVILFDFSAVIAVEMKEMREEVVSSLLAYDADGGTIYSSGLELAERVMIKASRDPTIEHKRPMIVFLSGGRNNGGGDPLYYVERMKQQEPRMILHSIMFGTDPTFNILQDMANIGNGTFQLSLDEVQLARSFEDLATSLKPKVAALM